jgi:uncharacterized protein
VALLESKLGLSPWDVLHQGIARHTPLSFGEAIVVVGVIVLAAAAAFGARPGLGTVANAVLVGTFTDLLLRLDAVRDLSGSPLLARIGLLAGGIWVIGVASGFYIGAGLGAGPRDSLMLALSLRTRFRIGAVRAGLELSALAAGIALGGTFGVGTVAFALLVGPSVELAFFLLERSPLAARPIGAPAG